MRQIDRRTLLCGITIGVLAAASRSPAARGFPTERPPPGVLTRLPGNGNQLALSVSRQAGPASRPTALRHRLGPRDMSLEAKCFRHVAVAVPQVHISRGVPVSPRQ
jgi:hypothetical protein